MVHRLHDGSSSKVKQLGPSSSTPWYTSEGTENIGSNKKHVHECYSKTIHHQKVEAIQNVHQHETDKCNMVYLCRGILFSLKQKEVVIHATTWINLENTMLSINNNLKSQTQSYIPCVFTYIESLE